MKHLLYIAIGFVLLSACSQKLSQEEEAAKAAQSYYQLLIDGQTDKFLQGKMGSDSFPDGYREQMLGVYEQYVREVKEEHGGIREVLISDNIGKTDSSNHLVYTFLVLCFGDSAQEEITVPMVDKDGIWKMK